MQKFIDEQKGIAIVEATILLPFCFIMVIALYYASIFMCQKANLQANLQTSLLYYKNAESDTYVEAKANMSYSGNSGFISAEGSSYGAPKLEFPYRFLGMSFEENKFKQFFHGICKYMFFDDGDDVIVKAKSHNYVVYKTIEATATQTVKPAISLAMVGAKDELTIEVSAEVVVNDSDDLIRNVDFVFDILENTKIGKKASEMVGKAQEIYDKFKTKFNI